MNSDRISDVDRALSVIRRSANQALPTSRGGDWSAARVARLIAVILVAAILPFLALVKLSVYMYVDYGVSAYVALLLAAFATCLLLVLYKVVFGFQLTGRLRLSKRTLHLVAVLVGVYCGYSLVFISAGNVKSTSVRDVYTELHPLLRLAISTLVLVDGDAIVTDAARDPEDYARMGLPRNERSLHFRQTSGYVHAVDLRTSGRGELRNYAVAKYFHFMGFATIRHVGTADHLHVSLAVRER